MSKLLFTGATGFIGRNLLPLLAGSYDLIDTLGRSQACTIRVDLGHDEPILNRSYDCVIHAAGMAHTIPSTPEEHRRMMAVNATGTERLCRALEAAGIPDRFIFLSSVAVYGRDKGAQIDESHPLSGRSTYARSKILAERFLIEWCRIHGVTLTILRLPLVIGPDAPGNLGSMELAIRRGRYLSLGGGKAIKSVVSIPAIATLIEKASSAGGIFNAIERDIPVWQIEADMVSRLNCRAPRSLPLWAARTAGALGSVLRLDIINAHKVSKLASSLTFSSEKARRELDWRN